MDKDTGPVQEYKVPCKKHNAPCLHGALRFGSCPCSDLGDERVCVFDGLDHLAHRKRLAEDSVVSAADELGDLTFG